jgi:hypothetical protein
MAVAFATEVLWSLTGQRFGFTSVKLRPWHNDASDTPFPDGWLSWPGTQVPPLGAGGAGAYYGLSDFFGFAFGTGCGMFQEIRLPAPVHAITEVRIDGVVLTPTAYRLDNSRILVRVDGSTWPSANNFSKADTQSGTWSITAQYGESVPTGAAIAIGELACEFVRGLNGSDCRLPRGVTQLARQGVTISMPTINDQFKDGLTGLYFVDMFIRTWNPKGLRSRAQAYSIDRGQRRRN